jgi:hypothetical protein
MAFSYDFTALTVPLNQVRLMVGDINESEPLLQDEEIAFVIGQSGSNIYAQAGAVARFIAAKLAREVDAVNEPLRQMFSQRMTRFLKLADMWEQQLDVDPAGAFASSAWDSLTPGSGERSTPAFYRGVASDPANDAAAAPPGADGASTSSYPLVPSA